VSLLLRSVLLIIAIVGSHSSFAYDHTYKSYDEILKQVVAVKGTQSFVDYTQLKSDTSKLDEFTDGIEYIGKDEFDSWSREQQMAFLINAYNAFTIKLILTEYPVDSIKDYGGFIVNSPWHRRFFTLFGKDSTLNIIEHELLRKVYKEPRLHFVLVCASISCPPLINEAFLADKLEQQFADASTNFLRDTERNRFDAENDKLELSKIFKWYKKDFIASAGSVNAYVAPWMTDDVALQTLIANKETKIRFLEYDWSLNDTKQ
jgi:hypothetical protein